MKGLTIFERRQNILRLLAEQPGLRVGDMATYFDVSEGTIRNDLNALEEDNRLRRVRGGAVLVSPAGLLTFTGNGQPTVTTEADSKERIARWAAETIEDGDTILLDASSTVQFMIPYLKSFERLTIVTNGLVTARQVARTTDHPVVLIGGVLIVRKLRRFDLVATFILVALATTLATTIDQAPSDATVRRR